MVTSSFFDFEFMHRSMLYYVCIFIQFGDRLCTKGFVSVCIVFSLRKMKIGKERMLMEKCVEIVSLFSFQTIV